MDEIIVKYLLDEATPEERREVEAWRSQTKENERYYRHLELIWLDSKKLAATSNVDENEAWLKFKQRAGMETGTTVTALPKKRFGFSLKAAAAILLLVFGAWMSHYLINQNTVMMVVASQAYILIDTLPDGSVVTLNKNSSITYPKHFDEQTRPVRLKGEAFFNVAPNKNKPFIIEVDDVAVTVVGTSFNVKSGHDETEITVETGVVTVAKKTNIVKVLPKQRAIVAKKNDKPIVAATSDELYNYYRTKEFVCNNTPLYKLVEALNSTFQANIVIGNNSIKNLPLTTTFKEDSLNEILNTVVQTFNLTIVQNDGKIILK